MRTAVLKKGRSTNFSSLTDRGFIAEPAEGWYFDGIFDGSGRKLSLETININIIRVKSKGNLFLRLYSVLREPAVQKTYGKGI